MSRHQFDFRKLQPAWLRWLLALAVVVPIVLLAWQSFRNDPIPEDTFAPFVPYVGAVVLAILALGVGLRLYGWWRERARTKPGRDRRASG
jgi:CHASE2 domain-containing sensor protein